MKCPRCQHENQPQAKFCEECGTALNRGAIALGDDLGLRLLQARCHVGLGKLYRETSNLHQAKAHVTNGVAMMRDLQMGLWLERAEAELNELD